MNKASCKAYIRHPSGHVIEVTAINDIEDLESGLIGIKTEDGKAYITHPSNILIVSEVTKDEG